jgi:hypothetical protein
MYLTDLLTPDRVAVRTSTNHGHDSPSAGGGGTSGQVPPEFSKRDALTLLASLLGRGNSRVLPAEIERVLLEREQLQSTGIGDGVAIPHGALPRIAKEEADQK